METFHHSLTGTRVKVIITCFHSGVESIVGNLIV